MLFWCSPASYVTSRPSVFLKDLCHIWRRHEHFLFFAIKERWNPSGLGALRSFLHSRFCIYCYLRLDLFPFSSSRSKKRIIDIDCPNKHTVNHTSWEISSMCTFLVKKAKHTNQEGESWERRGTAYPVCSSPLPIYLDIITNDKRNSINTCEYLRTYQW